MGKETLSYKAFPEILPPRSNYDVVLINVPVSFQQGPTSEGEEPPFGLGRIAIVGEKLFGLNTAILDLHRQRTFANITPDSIIALLEKVKPRLVGLNPTCVNVGEAREIADMLSQMGIPFIVGGYFATLDTKRALEIFQDAKAIVKGNGELVLPQIFNKLTNDDGIENIPGVYVPGINYPNFSVYAHKLSPQNLPTIEQERFFFNPVYTTPEGRKELSLYVTDGCPFNCGFCSSPQLTLRRYLRPTIQKIVNEIERGIEVLGANSIHFLDDLVLITPKHVEEFYQELIRRNLLGKFAWRGMSRANLIVKWPEEILELLRASGCYQIAFGVESGSERILKMINKGIKPRDVLLATERLTKKGINVKGFFIFGFPTETVEEMEQTKRLALEMAKRGATDIAVFEFHPYPGTSLWKFLEETNPEVLRNLSYIDYLQHNLSGRAADRVNKTSVWLPDDVRVATVPSRIVRKYVLSTIEEFYKIVNG